MQEVPNKYSSINAYESTQVAVHLLKNMKSMNVVRKLVGELVDFRDGRLVNHCVLMNLHTWLVALEKFSDAIDETTLQM